MNTVYFDQPLSDLERRRLLYSGQILVFSPNPSTLAFVDFARGLIEDAFKGQDAVTAQYTMAVEDYAAILGELKPKFIHHSESKRHLRTILSTFGADPEKTFFEVPKLRSSTSDGYLTAGIAYAWHPHRDTWYSAPPCQLNWWMPVYEIESTNAMAFHPQYWSVPVRNSSSQYNYYEWNKKYRGRHVQSFTTKDPRPLPAAIEPLERTPELRVICPVGGLIIFSGAQLHSSVPNTSGKTRFSIDFRTVNVDDLAERTGAPNIDSDSTGTVLREFMSVADLARIPADVLRMYEDGTEIEGALTFPAEVG